MAPFISYKLVSHNQLSKERLHLRPRPQSAFTLNCSNFCIVSCFLALTFICSAVSFHAGKKWNSIERPWEVQREDGLLDPQVIIGKILGKEVTFRFPSGYEDDGVQGDIIWNELMPLGSGFLRVSHPRKYAMPRSKKVEGDKEDAEIYSVSMAHQLHCLGVIRDVIVKYSKRDKSRFAGAGHEYHCLDYIRQAILCAGDTTLDHAEIEFNSDGSEMKYGFTGANATHRCRDWDTIRESLVKNRLDNKTGILL